MNLSLIFTLAVAVYALIWALAQLLLAKRRNWSLTLVRVGVTLVSAVASVPLAVLVAEMSADEVYAFLLPRLGAEVGGFLTEVPVGAEGLRVIAAMLVAPILYFVIFLVLRGILAIVCRILGMTIPFFKKKHIWNAGVALPLGAVNGILIAIVTLIPLCGFITMGSHLLGTFSDGEMADMDFVQENVLEPLGMTAEDLGEAADSLEAQPVVRVVNTVGQPIYTALTSATLDASTTHGEAVDMNLETELCGLLVMAGHAVETMEAMEKAEFTDADKATLQATADSFFESEWIRLLATDSLVALSEAWLNNETFAGLERPALDATLNPTLNRLMEVLASENPETLEEDIHVILDVVGDLLKADLLEENADYTAMVQRLGKSGLLTEVLGTLEESERLSVLATELKALSMRLVSNMLGVDKLKDGEYAEMMGSVAATLTDSLSMSEAERDAMVLESVKTNFAGQGFDVPDEVALDMSHQMIDELGADGEITEEELTNYLVDYAESGELEIPDGVLN